MKIAIVFGIIVLFLIPTIQACGWFIYEDIPETRIYYDAYDNIAFIEDSMLLMTRFPTPKEVEKNVYIPEIYNWGDEW